MKHTYFLSILLLLIVATNGYAHPTPSWALDHIIEITLRKNTKEVRVIKDIKKINSFARCLGRADTIVKTTIWSFIFGSSKYKEGKYNFDSTINVISDKPESAENGTWMYDSVQGVFSYLDPIIQSVYKLKDNDREVVNSFFETEQ